MFIEPFMGAASVFWNMQRGAFEQYILNDIDDRVVNFFHVLRERPDELMGHMRQMSHSRAEFKRQLDIMQGKCGCGSECHGDMQKALAFLYCMKTAHNACPVSKGNFRSGKEGLKSLWNGDFDLSPYADRLKGNVVVERMDFADLLERYDSDTSFTFADPPYVELGNDLYRHPFTEDDHVRLADCLSNLTGKFLLTYNDHPLVRSMYGKFNIMEAQWAYHSTAGKKNIDTGDESGESCRVGKELVIMNYDPMEAVGLFAQRRQAGHRNRAVPTAGRTTSRTKRK